jgi:hypothetical protein
MGSTASGLESALRGAGTTRVDPEYGSAVDDMLDPDAPVTDVLGHPATEAAEHEWRGEARPSSPDRG